MARHGVSGDGRAWATARAVAVARSVGGVRGGGVGTQDGAVLRLQGRVDVAERQQVEPAGLRVAGPPRAQERGGGAVRVGQFQHEVAAGAQGRDRRPEFLARGRRPFQLVEDADHVVAGAQAGQQAGGDQVPLVGLLDAFGRAGAQDPRGGVRAVEGRVRQHLPGDGREVAVAGADVQPALRFREVRQHGADPLQVAAAAGRAVAPVLVPLVERHALGG
ncbi:hypothetical protein GCM10020295_61120 [Streptomyces cinereospinus]